MNKRFNEDERYKYLQIIFDSILIPILLVHKSHRILLQNKTASDLFASKEGNLCWQELWGGKTLSKKHRELYENGTVLPDMQCYFCISDTVLKENRFRSKELKIFGKYWESVWLPIKKDIFMHYFIDISKQKESEERYRQAQKFLREITDLVPDLIWVKDLKRKYVFTNKANCEKLLCVGDVNEPIGKSHAYFADKIRTEKPNEPDYYTFDSTSNETDKIVIDTKKPLKISVGGNVRGRYLHLDVIKVPWFNDRKELKGVLSVARDTTEEEAIKKELEENKKKLQQSLTYHQALFENNAAAMVVVDKNRTIIDVNSSLLDALGYKKSELVGKKASILHVNESSFEEFSEQFREVLSGNLKTKTVEFSFKKKDNTTIWAQIQGSSIVLQNGEKGVIWSAINTTEIHELREQLKHQALHDALTGLYNRYVLENEAERAMERAKRNKSKLAVCLLDLDNFKNINDTFGHETGDMILKIIAKRLKESVRATDFVVRFGGDEFVILLENITDVKQLKAIFSNMHRIISKEIEIKSGIKIKVGVSIGAVLYPDTDANVASLLSFADLSMYSLKKNKNSANKDIYFKIYKPKKADINYRKRTAI